MFGEPSFLRSSTDCSVAVTSSTSSGLGAGRATETLMKMSSTSLIANCSSHSSTMRVLTSAQGMRSILPATTPVMAMMISSVTRDFGGGPEAVPSITRTRSGGSSPRVRMRASVATCSHSSFEVSSTMTSGESRFGAVIARASAASR